MRSRMDGCFRATACIDRVSDRAELAIESDESWDGRGRSEDAVVFALYVACIERLLARRVTRKCETPRLTFPE